MSYLFIREDPVLTYVVAKEVTHYWKRQFAYYSLQAWTPPVLTENGILGSDNFAVASSAFSGVVNTNASPAYALFANNPDIYWRSGAQTGWVTFYNPTPLIVNSLTWGYFYSYITGGCVFGSDDNFHWTALTTFTNSSAADCIIPVNSTHAYKYHRVQITGVNTDVIHGTFLSIDANELIPSDKDSADYVVELPPVLASSSNFDYITIQTLGLGGVL